MKNDFFTKNRVKTALRVGLAIYFFVNEMMCRVTGRYSVYTMKITNSVEKNGPPQLIQDCNASTIKEIMERVIHYILGHTA